MDGRIAPQPRRVYIKKWIAVFVIAVLNIPSGIPWFFGNLSAYTDSYFISKVGVENHTSGSLWLLSLNEYFCVIAFYFAKQLACKIGAWTTVLFGCLCINVSFAATYFSVQYSVLAMYLTLGIILGFFAGLVYAIGLCCLTANLPEHVGIVTSLLSMSFSTGSLVLNPIITFYINPDNKVPSGHTEETVYFTDEDILARVPCVFLILGVAMTGCQIICLVALTFLPSFSILNKPAPVDRSYLTTETVKFNHLDNADEHTSSITSTSLPRDLHESENDKLIKMPGKVYPLEELTPLQVIKTREFYKITFLCLPLFIGLNVVNNDYKQFGMIDIKDDHFFTTVALLVNIVVGLSRVVWGFVTEILGPKTSIVSYTSLITILMVFWFFTPMASKWLYLVWTLAIQAIHGAIYVNIPIMIFKCFGSQNYVSNYGVVFLFAMSFDLIAPTLTDAVLTTLGYCALFQFISVGSLISLLISITLPN